MGDVTTGHRIRLFLATVACSVVIFLGAGIFVGNHATDEHHSILQPWVARWDCAHTMDCTSTP